MYIYFVRHGETEYNRKGIHQPPDVPLSPVGREQIQKATIALKKLPITALLTSDLNRARESAEIIGSGIDLIPQENKLWREVRRPSSLFNKRHISAPTLRAGVDILYHLNDPVWHYLDEENLYDIRKRIQESVAFLSKLRKEHEHVAIVSHALIINLFVKYMCQNKLVLRRDYLKSVFAAKRFSNASISTVTYNNDHNEKTCDWICTSLNETSHL